MATHECNLIYRAPDGRVWSAVLQAEVTQAVCNLAQALYTLKGPKVSADPGFGRAAWDITWGDGAKSTISINRWGYVFPKTELLLDAPPLWVQEVLDRAGGWKVQS